METDLQDQWDEGQKPLVAELNSADEQQFVSVPGIGPVLARRIVEYRDMHGPFASIDGLLAVVGIGPVLLGQLSPYLAIAPVQGGVVGDEQNAEDDALSEMLSAEPVPEGTATAMSETAPADDFALPRETEAAAIAEAPEVYFDEPTPAEELLPEDVGQPSVLASTAPSQPAAEVPKSRGQWAWLGGALLGALLGLGLTLFVFSLINGSVDLRWTPAIQELSGRADSLAQTMDGLRADIDELGADVTDMQGRLQLLEGLPGRMEAVEDSVDELETTVRDLAERTGALTSRVASVEEDLTEVRERTDKVEGFFAGLTKLLTETFGSAPQSPNP